VGFDAAGDYPLGTRRPDLVRTPGGLALDELTLDALRDGLLDAAARPELAANLVRAAELTAVPDEVILEIYTGLRPHRSTPEQLEHLAARLEREFGAPTTAAFVREAKEVYAKRDLLSR
jgi:propanediol dehydratase small subunit